MYEYKATVTGVYDGDSITVDIDLGFGVFLHKQKIRLANINTPEVRGPERTWGLAVRDWVRERILGKPITLRTSKGPGKGKYGRWLAVVLYDDDQGNLDRNLNEQLVSTNRAEEKEY